MLNGGVCTEGGGSARPGPAGKGPLQPQGLLCLQKQPELQLEFRKSPVGGVAELVQTWSCHPATLDRRQWPLLSLSCTLAHNPVLPQPKSNPKSSATCFPFCSMAVPASPPQLPQLSPKVTGSLQCEAPCLEHAFRLLA